MPPKKHDRSHYSHLDSIDAETLASLSTSIAGLLTPYFQPPHALPVEPADGPSIDAFGRFRTSTPTGLFDSQNQYDTSPILWESVVTNNSGNAAVTHLPNESTVRLNVDANDTIVRQTRHYFHYQPGKSQQIFMTFAAATPFANLTQRIGYFDAQNGIFFEITSSGIANIVKRSFTTGVAVETRIPQSAWNLDRLDGTGVSNHTIDFSKSIILAIDLEWLGVGRVRVGFSFDGLIHWAHAFVHSNELTTTYMTTANLPLRYEIAGAGGLAGVRSLRQICSQVSSEGGIELERGHLISVGRGASLVATTTRRPILSIRPALTFNSIVNRIFTILEDVTIYSASVTAYYEVVYGGALTGPNFVAVGSYSGVEYDVTASALTGGITIVADYVPATVQARGKSIREFSTRYPMSLNAAGAHPTTPFSDIVTLVATSLGTSTDIGATMTWREIR